MKWIIVIAAFAGIIGFEYNKNKSQEKVIIQPLKKSFKSFAVLELFTSEGCSSCPPADKLLPQLAALDSNIIALSFHVDYWDHLGWKDPFSNAGFSERQRKYGGQFHLESIYTPQLVINGRYELVGSNRLTAEADIKRVLEEKAAVQLSIDEVKKEDKKLLISCQANGDFKNTDLLVALVQTHAEMKVRAGENEGANLSHTNVVRSFIHLPVQPTMNVKIDLPGDLAEANWKLILYTQQNGDLKITGVAVYEGNKK